MADGKKTDSYALDMEKLDAEGDRFRPATPTPPSRQNTAPPAIANHPMLPILSYCGSSILMTVTNKYCLSGLDFNLNFFLLCVQVCGWHIRSCFDLSEQTVSNRIFFCLVRCLRGCDPNVQVVRYN
jgi:hypothetical protein